MLRFKLIFTDAHYHANICMQYKCGNFKVSYGQPLTPAGETLPLGVRGRPRKTIYFVGLIFTAHESTVKTMKIGPLEISHCTV